VRVADVVGRDELLLGVLQNPLELTLGGLRNAALTSATVTALSTTTARSVNDTSGVGTRMAMPSIFPLSSGITSDVAFAARSWSG
jgi:hypothetical protein